MVFAVENGKRQVSSTTRLSVNLVVDSTSTFACRAVSLNTLFVCQHFLVFSGGIASGMREYSIRLRLT